MSWAGTVWGMTGAGRSVFVKRAADLVPERNRLAWLVGRWPVPEVAGFFHESGDDWLVTREVFGVRMYHPALGWEPVRVANKLGEILRNLHSTDAAGCPFGINKRGHVLIHGDYCLPNVLVQKGELSGLVDVGGAGLGNPEDDLAAGVWRLRDNQGPGLGPTLLCPFCLPPPTSLAVVKRRRQDRPLSRPTASHA